MGIRFLILGGFVRIKGNNAQSLLACASAITVFTVSSCHCCCCYYYYPTLGILMLLFCDTSLISVIKKILKNCFNYCTLYLLVRYLTRFILLWGTFFFFDLCVLILCPVTLWILLLLLKVCRFSWKLLHVNRNNFIFPL